MPRFSIFTPVFVHDEARLAKLLRAIGSVANQTFKDFEMIIVDDGSRIEWTPPQYDWLKVIKQDHLERLIAYNAAFKEAKGEIITFLDSDDEYISHYLECIDQMFKLYPEYKVFNWGSIHIHPTYEVRLRGTFKPDVEGEGHKIFGGGNIVNGTFAFKKECIVGEVLFPHVTNPWDFSTCAQEEFPEIRELFTVVNEAGNKVVRELGNPMGNDFFLFYKLTRTNHSKPIDVYLYIVHHKGKVGLRI